MPLHTCAYVQMMFDHNEKNVPELWRSLYMLFRMHGSYYKQMLIYTGDAIIIDSTTYIIWTFIVH